MIRISFNKITFSNPIKESHVFFEVSNQKGQLFKICLKRIKGNIAKIYGDFIQVLDNSSQLQVKVFVTVLEKNCRLIEKLLIEKNSYGFKQKKSHIIQKGTLRIFFDSQIIKETQSTIEQNQDDFSNYVGNEMLPQRLCLIKQMRGFSTDQRKVLERFQSHHQKNLSFKNVTFFVLKKSHQEKQIYFK